MNSFCHPRLWPAVTACILVLTSNLRAQTAGAPTPAAGASDEEVVSLSEFVVTAASEGYSAADSTAGIRFRTQMLTLPKAINVATRQFIDDIGAQSLADIIPYMAGGTPETVNGASQVDVTNRFRGVATNFAYRNGFRGFAPVDTIAIDRVEVVKGPSSFFGGQVQAGGFVNYVTKKPNGQTYSSIRQILGTYDNYRTELETSGKIAVGKQRAVRYRGAFLYQTTDTFRDFEHQEKVSPFVSLDFKPFTNTTVSVEYQYLVRRQDIAYTSPLYLATGATATGNYVRFPYRRSFNPFGPGAHGQIATAFTEVAVDQRITNWLTARVSAFQARTRFELFQPNGVGQFVTVNPTTGVRTIARNNTLYRTQANKDRTGRADLVGTWSLPHLRLRAYIGRERVYGKFNVSTYTSRTAGLPALNIDDPVYNIGTPADATSPNLNQFYGIYDATSVGGHVEIWERLNVFGGTRQDDGYSERRLGVGVTPGTAFKVNTPNVGASLKLNDRVAVYINHSQAFVPNSGMRFDGTMIEPLTGVGTDWGVKFQGFLENRLAGLITVFNQDTKNSRIADPEHPGYFTTSGGFDNSQGVEVDLTWTLLPNWTATTGYAFVDARTTSSTNPAAVGIRMPNTPTHQVNLVSRYAVQKGSLKGLTIVGAGRYVGNRRSGSGPAADTSGNRLPGYITLDLTLAYTHNLSAGRRATFSAAVRNLTDRDYYLSTTGFGAPRTVEGSVGLRF